MARTDYVIAIGAPAYRLQLDARHGQMLCLLGQHADSPLPAPSESRTLRIGPVGYLHTTLLAPGRARVLAGAMEWRSPQGEQADALLSVDADTFCEIDNLLSLLAIAASLPAQGWAQLALLVPQDDGRVNAWSAPGERLAAVEPWQPIAVHAVGAAIALHNLHWHRAVIARGGKTWPWSGYACVPLDQPGAYIGEDHYHCTRVRELGGRVLAINAGRGVYHAAFAGEQRK